MHISSLPGKYSCGSFGKEAREFIDFLADCGFSYWQVLPFCPIDEYNSPYKSHSSFGGNPYFIDLDVLFQKGLLTEEELKTAEQETPYLCEFERLSKERLELLSKAAKRAENIEEIEAVITQNSHLENFCRFMALKTANHFLPWQEWKTEKFDPEILFLWKFIQFEFFSQWKEIKAYANQKGIGIIGDIPFYVSPDSSDLWANTDLFQLDERNRPTAVAGVPPDYFCEDGQLWGNPLYDWDKMKEDGYRWWLERISFMLELFDGLRIDHFRAFEAYWAVPAEEETARNGKWVKGPGMDLIEKIKEVAGEKLVIAEDLGHITKEVEALVEESGFPGMRVFQFGFFGGESTHMPHNYPQNSIAYGGTHDNNTLLGYLWELDDDQRKNMLAYCGYTDADWTKALPAIIRTIWRSHAGTVILTIQDLLGYGSDTRLNFPGRAENNWRYRVTADQIKTIDKDWIRGLNTLYYR
ncbi:MAG: 4-alpha-glucanotransferase [Clostridia bacterium]|nr:4-alpha-glucanotransferase [Clostridia bacterium]